MKNLTLLYEHLTGPVAFSLYGYSNEVSKTYNFGFLWVGPGPASAPDLEATWAQQGMYTFFPGSDQYDWPSLSASIYALYGQFRSYHLRFAWTGRQAFQLIAGLYVDNGKVINSSNLSFAQFALIVNQESEITLNAAKDGFVVKNKNFSFLPDRFTGTQTLIPFTSDLLIIVSGQLQGILRFSLDMTIQALNSCHAGLHYYCNQPDPGYTNQTAYRYYFAFDYPVINPLTKISLQANVDLLAPENPTRTCFTIIDKNFRSFFTSRTGRFLYLEPADTVIGGGNGFALVNYPKAAQQTGALCFSLQGTYAFAPDETPGSLVTRNDTLQLLCGISGTEHIEIVVKNQTYAGDLIDFVPGNIAYAPTFPLLGQQTTGGDTPLLEKNEFCLTSWIQVRKNVLPPSNQVINYYYSQPADAALFKPDSSATGQPTFIPVFDAEAGNTFDGSSGATGQPKCFPMVPYALSAEGASELTPPGGITDFELQILNPFRKRQIVTKAEISNRQQARNRFKGNAEQLNSGIDSVNYTTTPQGLLVKVLSDPVTRSQYWDTLVFANNQAAGTGKNTSLRIENINAVIQNAFQTNQQFLVVARKGSFGTPAATADAEAPVYYNTIPIAGWPFHIDIGSNDYGEYSNIMVLKFCKGTFTDRVSNTQNWTQPEDFAGDANAQVMLSRWLVNYCNHVDLEFSKGNAAFTNIHRIIHDPNWNGILALNVNIGLSDFPPEIKGLLGGIDTTRFKADHFGIEVNQIKIENGILQNPDNSSLFGLIDYTDAGYINGQQPTGATDVDYNFKVLKLMVLFKNSAIVDFKSKLQLTINSLFGDGVVEIGGSGIYNTILLDGTYENHNGIKSYIFNETGDQQFSINNNVLQAVEILKVQFSTLSTDPNSHDIHSKFSIWGYMNFASLKALDAFSFDKLAMSNLNILMNFSDENPAVRTFTFDPSTLSFDTPNSKGRVQSLALNYPLAIKGLISGDGSQLPKDLGYLPVLSPLDADSQAIPAKWYGLSFNLNLGTLGAMASKVGLNASILLVWGTGLQDNSSFAAAAFIQLPGTGGSSNFFSLQNVLKLSIGGIRLYVDLEANPGNISYLIKFSNIALKVLSKELPPNGKIGMFLFGDPGKKAGPSGDPTQSSLGWYAAYQKDKKIKR